MERANETAEIRKIIVAVLRRMSRTGESHEMAARWIMEEFSKYGYEVVTNDRP